MRTLSIGSNYAGFSISLLEANELVAEDVSSFESGHVSALAPGELRRTIADKISDILKNAEIDIGDINTIVCYGPIAGEISPQIEPPELTPAGVRELRAGVRQIEIPEIASQPLNIIPGVRNFFEDFGPDSIGSIDYLCGEETVLFGIVKLLRIKTSARFVFCGPRTKTASLDDDGRIVEAASSYSGRLAATLATEFPRSISLPPPGEISIDRGWLRRGARAFIRAGLPRALYEADLMIENIEGLKPSEIGSYLIGLVVQADIDSSWRGGFFKADDKIYVAGENPWREAMAALLVDEAGAGQVVEISEQKYRLAGPLGAESIVDSNG